MWRSGIGRKRSASAGLPASMTRSRIKPLLPVARLSLWPYGTPRPPLMMMSACGSNRLSSFSGAGTAWPWAPSARFGRECARSVADYGLPGHASARPSARPDGSAGRRPRRRRTGGMRGEISDCDRAGTSRLCRGGIGCRQHSAWPGAGGHASGSLTPAAVWPSGAAVATSPTRHPTTARCRSAHVSGPR